MTRRDRRTREDQQQVARANGMGTPSSSSTIRPQITAIDTYPEPCSKLLICPLMPRP
jgi:hypothetical protein